MWLLSKKIQKDTSFVYKMFRYHNRVNYKDKLTYDSRVIKSGNKKIDDLITDYIKMKGYKTVVKTIFKLELPIELSRDVCKFL